MPYKTRGETHYGGINNEKELVKLLNSKLDVNINSHFTQGTNNIPIWKHLGGTTQKADCEVNIGNQCFDISIKNHENTGTFDWINTSKLEEFNEELGKSVKKSIDKFKKDNYGNEITKNMRDDLANIFNSEFDHITSDQIKILLTIHISGVFKITIQLLRLLLHSPHHSPRRFPRRYPRRSPHLFFY